MSFHWEDYLDLASRLLAGPAVPMPGINEAGDPTRLAPPTGAAPVPSEAALRTAVSRAYYAAYHLARDYLESNGRGSPPAQNSHEWVWKQFDRQRRREEGQIREEGFTLNKARKAADYDTELPSWQGGPSRPGAVVPRVKSWKELADFTIRTAQRIQSLLRHVQPRM